MSLPASVNPKILVVDDQPDSIELLEYNLIKAGYQVQTALSGKKAIERAKAFLPDLILLDIMLPDMDGVQVCEQLRQLPAFFETKIVFLTARDEEYAEVAAFEAGADDYLIKPIRMRALLSRLRTVFHNRERTTNASKLVRDQLLIDRNSYSVTYQGKQFELPRKEFELLFFLAQHPDQVFTREQLITQLWGEKLSISPRTVDVHVRKIREKISEAYIITVKNIGYRFSASKDSAT